MVFVPAEQECAWGFLQTGRLDTLMSTGGLCRGITTHCIHFPLCPSRRTVRGLGASCEPHWENQDSAVRFSKLVRARSSLLLWLLEGSMWTGISQAMCSERPLLSKFASQPPCRDSALWGRGGKVKTSSTATNR